MLRSATMTLDMLHESSLNAVTKKVQVYIQKFGFKRAEIHKDQTVCV